MPRTLKRLVITGLMAAMPLGLLAGAANATTTGHLTTTNHPAAAAHRSNSCPIDEDGDCVQTIAGESVASPYLTVRDEPSRDFGSVVGSLPYGTWGRAFCWYYNPHDMPGGDPYWDYGYYNGTWGWVADYYLYTGGDITTQIDQGSAAGGC